VDQMVGLEPPYRSFINCPVCCSEFQFRDVWREEEEAGEVAAPTGAVTQPTPEGAHTVGEVIYVDDGDHYWAGTNRQFVDRIRADPSQISERRCTLCHHRGHTRRHCPLN
jgi:hypothetical protein